MAGNIQCLHCGVVLNLPDQAAGRRMRCPRCGGKFVVGKAGKAEVIPTADATGANKGPDTTFELTEKSTVELPVMPTAAGDLRDTFDFSTR